MVSESKIFEVITKKRSQMALNKANTSFVGDQFCLPNFQIWVCIAINFNRLFCLKFQIFFGTLKRSHSVNFDRTRKLQTFLEPSDSDLSKTIVFQGSISNRKMSRAANVRTVRKPRFWTYIYVMAVNVLTGPGEKFFLCSNVFFSIKKQVKIIFRKNFFRFGVG